MSTAKSHPNYWRLLGEEARNGAEKLYPEHPELAQWPVFRGTFGFFRFKKKNNMTDQQIAEFQDGFENYKPVRKS